MAITLTTVDSEKTALEISEKLIEKKLAACVQLEEITSVYIWKNDIQREEEIRLMVKHPVYLINEVSQFLSQIHPYDTPEILQLKGSINQSYKSWCTNWCK